MLRYGLGYYSANKPTMDLFRHTLRQRPRAFREVAACCRPPFELVGESYKRPLVKEQAAEIATVQPQVVCGDGDRQRSGKAVQRRSGAAAGRGILQQSRSTTG